MNGLHPDWRSLLRDSRTALAMTRDQLAERSGVAAATVKAYELGQRNPSRQLLTALLTALDVDRLVRNEILEGAGFRPDGLDVWPSRDELALSLDDAVREISNVRWPAILTGDGMKLLAENRAFSRLRGRENSPPGSPEGDAHPGASIFTWMSHPAVATRIKNWDELMAFLIGQLKGSLRFPEHSPEGSTTAMEAAFERFLSGDAWYIDRYLSLWEKVPPTRAKTRFTYRVVIDHPLCGLLAFHCLGMGVNEMDGLVISDWVPEDADTWLRLEQGGVVPVRTL
jgi:transcriptional regulator with XRE-family HTH domain